MILAGSVAAGLWLGGARAGLARQRAETAADLAALASAESAGDGETGGAASGQAAPCRAAAAIAARNGATLDACDVSGGTASVQVTVAGPTPATARARAGPVAAP